MTVDKSDEVRNHFVYRYFDAHGALLYVGCSHRPEIRLKEHRSQRPAMCAAIARIKVAGPYCYRTAREIERTALRAEEPICGWTPAKQREKARRDRWIDDRVDQLVTEGGMPLHQAIKVAVADAERDFPNPMASPYDRRPDRFNIPA